MNFSFCNYIVFIVVVLSACADESSNTKVVNESKEAKTHSPKCHFNNELVYSWGPEVAKETSICQQIPPPGKASRVEVGKSSYAQWLRQLPLKPKEAKVRTYDGGLKMNQNAHYRIIEIDVGKKDLQQCADAVMRLKAEYHYAAKEYEQIHFNFTSGDKVSFEDWRRGRKPKIKGNKVSFTEFSDKNDDSYSNFKSYLTSVFTYAGTASLEKELVVVPLKKMQIGDVFIQGGFPGHAVLVIDMAKDDKGNTYFMVAQSYMPAQEIQILKNLGNKVLSPWYKVDEAVMVKTPEWNFYPNQLRRFQ